MRTKSIMTVTKILTVKNVCKTYATAGTPLNVLKDITFEISSGESVAIIGPSGSGKTTLLGLCAGLDNVTSGSVLLQGIQLNNLDEDERAKIRNRHVGFVFQNFQLIPTLTSIENTVVPAEIRGDRNSYDRAHELLGRVGLSNRADHYPIQLSGGEQQRVALARAFINTPSVLFVDEPTGNLDTETSTKIERLLLELNEESGTTLITVTHDLELANRLQRVIRLDSGQIAEDYFPNTITNSKHIPNLEARP